MTDFRACPSCASPIKGPAETCPVCGEALPAAAAHKKDWRIPCPGGHVHLAADAWIGTGRQAFCPTCSEPFTARIGDSLEKRDETQRRQDLAVEKLAKQWLGRAIWGGAIFGLVLLALIVWAALKSPVTP